MSADIPQCDHVHGTVAAAVPVLPRYRQSKSTLRYNQSKVVFEYKFTYNNLMQKQSTHPHPADQWAKEAQHQSGKIALHLAVMAGHMGIDKIAARRAALADLLADGRPHTRETIWQQIADRLEEDCWGKLPQEALARDLAVLRKGGIRIAYSRRPGATGYYLQHPPLKRPDRRQYGAVNWELIERIKQLSTPEKNERAFAAADFALRQKKLILAEQHPQWSPERVSQEARRLVFGISEELLSEEAKP